MCASYNILMDVIVKEYWPATVFELQTSVIFKLLKFFSLVNDTHFDGFLLILQYY